MRFAFVWKRAIGTEDDSFQLLGKMPFVVLVFAAGGFSRTNGNETNQ